MWSASSHPSTGVTRIFLAPGWTLLGTSGSDGSSGQIYLLNALGQEKNKTAESSVRVAGQRSLLHCSLSQKLSLDTDAYPEDWFCLIPLQAHLFWRELAFLGCLLWPFLLSSSSQTYSSGRQMIWTLEWSLLSFGDLLPFPGSCCLRGPSEGCGLFLGRRALALPGSSTMFLLLPFDSLIVNLLGISLTVLFTLLLVFIIVPAIFGVSFGIRKLYMKTLLKIFAVSGPVYKWFLHRGGKKCPQQKVIWLIFISVDMEKVGRMGNGIRVKRIAKCVHVTARSSLSFWAEVLVCVILLCRGACSMTPHLACLLEREGLRIKGKITARLSLLICYR